MIQRLSIGNAYSLEIHFRGHLSTYGTFLASSNHPLERGSSVFFSWYVM